MNRIVHFPSTTTSRPRWRVELTKGDRRRFYEILPAGADTWQAWVRFDGKPHRSKCTTSVVQIQALRDEFHREIAALLADGWTITASSEPPVTNCRIDEKNV